MQFWWNGSGSFDDRLCYLYLLLPFIYSKLIIVRNLVNSKTTCNIIKQWFVNLLIIWLFLFKQAIWAIFAKCFIYLPDF